MKTTLKNTLFILLTISMFASCSKNKDPKPTDEPADYNTLIAGNWKTFIENYFQENGKDNREFVGGDESFHIFEFTQDRKLKTEVDPKGLPYTISGHQLTVGSTEYTITKLNKSNLVFERIIGREIEHEGKKGTLYLVWKGTK